MVVVGSADVGSKICTQVREKGDILGLKIFVYVPTIAHACTTAELCSLHPRDNFHISEKIKLD